MLLEMWCSLLERINDVNMYEIYKRKISDVKMNNLRKLLYKYK